MQGGVQVHVAGGGLEWRGLHGGSSGSYAVGSQVFFALAVTVENCREVDSSSNSPQISKMKGADREHHLKCFHRRLSNLLFL